jgi:hypothetical protein
LLRVVAAPADAVEWRTIKNEHSNKCLEIYHSSRSNGATVDQWTCNNTYTQRWVLQNGTFAAYG